MRGKVDVCFAKHAETREEHWSDPPLDDGEEVAITTSIRISCLTDELRQRIDEASQERGSNVGAAMRSLTYGIVREGAPSGSWDPDNVIARILALSRIVHPSTLGGDVAGSLHFDDAGELQCIFGVSGSVAYGCESLPPWLTRKDCEDLNRIYNAYEALPIVHPASFQEPSPTRRFPLRLHRALWNLAYAATIKPSHIR
jgi:hypothetical protein